MKFLVWFVVLSVLNGSHVSGCLDICTASPHPDFDDFTSPLYRLWEKTSVTTTAECSVHCARDNKCNSFVSNAATGTCIGYAGSLTTPSRSGATADNGARSYLMCTAHHQIGHSCVSDADCHPVSSVCTDGACDCPQEYSYSTDMAKCISQVAPLISCEDNLDCQVLSSSCDNGYCKCILGYSYDVTNLICTPACLTYGNTYTPWEGVDKACNDASENVPTFEQCLDTCSSSSLCRIAKYSSTGECVRCNQNWFGLTVYPMTYPQDWTFYIRNCF